MVAHNLPTLSLPARPCLTVPAGTPTSSLAGCHLHRAALPTSDVVLHANTPVTSVARTVIDVARKHGLDCGVVAADAALHARMAGLPDLAQVVDRCAGWPGRHHAAATLNHCDGSAESPLESLSRLRMAEHGLPPPSTQVELGDELGRFVGRVDFYWPEFGVAGEADGATKYQDPNALVAEKLRPMPLEHPRAAGCARNRR